MEILYIILIVAMYFLAGINKISSFNNTVAGFKKKLPLNLPNQLYNLIIIMVILLEILAPLIIVYASISNTMYNEATMSAQLLAAFTVLATLLYHPPTQKSEFISFLKNLTAIGGLMLLSVYL